MHLTSAILLLTLLQRVTLAQQGSIISITSPLTGTRYQAGSDAIITWVNPNVDVISQILLARGPSTALQPIITIAQNVKASDGKYVWKIPTELPDGDDCK
ncbi:hypothetical protein BDF14DRAFT_1794079 [Spinellus fusiger]|nr:hypothetical protein BDF14DRAFT_1794079 [Spinellus fusiger]